MRGVHGAVWSSARETRTWYRGYAYQVTTGKARGGVGLDAAAAPAAAGRYEGSSEAAASNVPRIRWGAAGNRGRRYAPDSGTKQVPPRPRPSRRAANTGPARPSMASGTRSARRLRESSDPRPQRRPLIKYGVGADLYFMGLKAPCIFLVSILSLPASSRRTRIEG